MSRAPATLAAIAFAVAAFGQGPSGAHGQELAVDPQSGEIHDYDEERESYSDFWEKALSPAAGTYEDLIAQASSILSDKNRTADARTLLLDAIASRPDAALAYFWLGLLERRAKNYAACASALGSAQRIEPTFRAPANASGLPSDWQLDFDLGLCQALAGDYPAALNRFESIMSQYPSCEATSSRRDPSCYHWQVPWRHGETLMALGRLEEAIASLESVSSSNLEIQFTLAVALERDEQLAEAKTIMDRAISADQNLRSLTAEERDYIPATDELYYRGLVRWHRHELAHARLFFRAYLKEAPTSPWRTRASAHLEEADAAGSAAVLLEVQGHEMSAAAAALLAASDKLEACARGFPAQLFDVRIVQGKRTDPGRKKPTEFRSVTVQHHDPLSKRRDAADIIKVTQCLRAAAESMSLPPLTASATGSMRFYVAGSP